MPVCGHEKIPFGEALCSHLRACREPWLSYVRWYSGSDLEADLICIPCAEERQKGLLVEAELVCEECYQYAITEVGDLSGTRGKPGIRIRSEPFDTTLKETPLPKEVGTIVDIAPVNQQGRSIWLLLADGGQLFRFDADTGDRVRLASARVSSEPDHKPWVGYVLRQHLYASNDGRFAAVANDYGRYGQVIDLRSGKATIALNGGEYHSETVPFSFAFAELNGRVVAIHRTAWNRLDVSDPSSGEVLTQRGPTAYLSGETRPEHYLDYFHGAIYVSPKGTKIVDDGWVWQPVGMPSAWSLERWLSENAWESEDGPTRKDLCARGYYWNHAISWLDESRVAIEGIGDEDSEMIDGARIFDVMQRNDTGRGWRSDSWAYQVTAFAGPAGVFFSDGAWLFSSDKTGLSRWDPEDGARTGFLQNFNPTHHHRGARELLQLIDGVLVRWRMSE